MVRIFKNARDFFLKRETYFSWLILGNNPELVCRHLSKLYDSISKLKWKMESGSASKIANGMIAKDGEYMAMYGTCDCNGKVLLELKLLHKI